MVAYSKIVEGGQWHCHTQAYSKKCNALYDESKSDSINGALNADSMIIPFVAKKPTGRVNYYSNLNSRNEKCLK
jgi:hypothetical protein